MNMFWKMNLEVKPAENLFYQYQHFSETSESYEVLKLFQSKDISY